MFLDSCSMSEDYSQPDFYRFNQDSLLFVKWIMQNVSAAHSLLDLGAGSGIIGIELARAFKPQRLTLVEAQSGYESHITHNAAAFVPVETQTKIVMKSFADFSTEEKFDLVVCNPPYYLPERGKISPDPARAIARSFILDSWEILLKKVSEVMSPSGKCFFVLKNDEWLFRHIQDQAHAYDLNVSYESEQGMMFLTCVILPRY